MILYDVGVEEFEAFSNWLYTKEVVVQEMEEEEAGHDKSEASNDSGSDVNEELGNHEAERRPESNDDSLSTTNGTQDDHNTPTEADVEPDTEDKTWYAGVNRKGRIFARLLDLYIFADTYKIFSFKRAVMLKFQRFIESTETLPRPTIVKHALDNLDFDQSMMCRYLTHCYGHYTDFEEVSQDRFATLSPAFLTAVLMIAFRPTDGGEDIGGWDDDWCAYHDMMAMKNARSVKMADKRMQTSRRDGRNQYAAGDVDAEDWHQSWTTTSGSMTVGLAP